MSIVLQVARKWSVKRARLLVMYYSCSRFMLFFPSGEVPVSVLLARNKKHGPTLTDERRTVEESRANECVCI